jgi:hypothetical protein
MSDSRPDPQPLSEIDRERLRILRSEVGALAEAVTDGSLTAESLVAGIEAIAQVPLDPKAVLDAVHVPLNAGEFEDGLERILHRIPDGWGRWISCDAGWYPIIVRLDEQIASLAPGYVIQQVKEKYGTLRFYWGIPYREPSCCVERGRLDPRPVPGAASGPFAPTGRSAEDQIRLEEWLARQDEHRSSDEHRRVERELYETVDHSRSKETRERIDALVAAAEDLAACTCELCGATGFLQSQGGWLKTLCPTCGSSEGYEPREPG